MLHVSTTISLPLSEIEFTQIRASGPGGQHVNKVSSAIHLRFDIARSSLPDFCKHRLLNMADRRIAGDGCIVIKAQSYRSLEKNKEEALQRLRALIMKASDRRKKRVPTGPSRAAQKRRLEVKQQRSRKKQLRRKISESE